jgi:hypothetical protein
VARGVPNNQRFPFGAWRRPGDRPYLVSFIDNHDAFWQPGRIRSQADDNQVIGCIGFLLCALGTPCIYHGTEQGLSGSGGDLQMRETMFDAGSGVSLLTTGCRIYQEIAKVAALMRKSEPPRFGRMYYRQISADCVSFGFPYGSTYTLALSRLLYARDDADSVRRYRHGAGRDRAERRQLRGLATMRKSVPRDWHHRRHRAVRRVALSRGEYPRLYVNLRDRFEAGKPIWLTETADAACGGNPWAYTFSRYVPLS